jgi:single-strand DNA-binding protein
MEIKGTIKLIGDTQNFKDSFTKKSIVVTTDEKYSNDIEIEFIKDKISLINNLNVGDYVTVGININGRGWLNPETKITKYFTSIIGWKLDVGDKQTESIPVGQESEEDLPF